MGDQFPEAQHAKRQVLCGNQCILVKQGCLHASKAHIHDCRAALDIFLELRVLCRNGFVADKTLLRIADDLYINSGPLPKLL